MNIHFTDRTFDEAKRALFKETKLDLLACIKNSQDYVAETLRSRGASLESVMLCHADVVETLLVKEGTLFSRLPDSHSDVLSERSAFMQRRLTRQLFAWVINHSSQQDRDRAQNGLTEYLDSFPTPGQGC